MEALIFINMVVSFITCFAVMFLIYDRMTDRIHEKFDSIFGQLASITGFLHLISSKLNLRFTDIKTTKDVQRNSQRL